MDNRLNLADADLIPTQPALVPNVIVTDSGVGRWHQMRRKSPNDSPVAIQQEQLEQIMSMGYLQGSQEATTEVAVTKLEPNQIYDAMTLVVSGHSPGAELIDMKGNVLHSWRRTFEECFPGRVVTHDESQMGFWRRAHLYPDGSIIGIFEFLGAVKLDANSNVIWAKDNNFHHDLSVADDGTIYLLERVPAVRPEVNPGIQIFDDHVTRLTPEGNIIDSVSLVDCVLNSPCKDLFNRIMLDWSDIFHTNTVKVINKQQASLWPIAKPGMVLVSLHQVHTIALVDLAEKKIVWWATDKTRYQHDPVLMPNGHILVFDNVWCSNRSRVVEIDPASREIVWQFAGTPQDPFYSLTCSTVQYLPNGNRLITVSDEGRAFSLDRNNTVVWEYVNPHRAGDNNELVATLFQCERLPKNFPTSWINKKTVERTSLALSHSGKGSDGGSLGFRTARGSIPTPIRNAATPLEVAAR